METPEITRHAILRARQRLKWNAETISRMALKAFNEGIQHYQTTGKLNKYLTSLYFKEEDKYNVRIYGEHVFLFKEVSLVTIFQLPRELRVLAIHTARRVSNNATQQ